MRRSAIKRSGVGRSAVKRHTSRFHVYSDIAGEGRYIRARSGRAAKELYVAKFWPIKGERPPRIYAERVGGA